MLITIATSALLIGLRFVILGGRRWSTPNRLTYGDWAKAILLVMAGAGALVFIFVADAFLLISTLETVTVIGLLIFVLVIPLRPVAEQAAPSNLWRFTGQILLAGVLIAILLVCLMLKWLTAGWMVIFLGIYYVAICVLHSVIHFRSVINPFQPLTSRTVGLALLSHDFLLSGFMLQFDFADGPHGWLTIAWLIDCHRFDTYPPPGWWPLIPSVNFLVFLPVCVSWLLLLRSQLRQPLSNFRHRLRLSSAIIISSTQTEQSRK